MDLQLPLLLRPRWRHQPELVRCARPAPGLLPLLAQLLQREQPRYHQDITSAWQNDENERQIDWNALYQANYNNLFTVQNANGVSGNNITGLRSKYIVEDQRADPTRIALNTVWSRALKHDVHVTAGASWNKQKTHYFKTLLDLLGGDFWVDLNQFAELDGDDPNGSQNNLDNPNNVVKLIASSATTTTSTRSSSTPSGRWRRSSATSRPTPGSPSRKRASGAKAASPTD